MKDIKRKDLINAIETGLKESPDAFFNCLKVIAASNKDSELYGMLEQLHNKISI